MIYLIEAEVAKGWGDDREVQLYQYDDYSRNLSNEDEQSRVGDFASFDEVCRFLRERLQGEIRSVVMEGWPRVGSRWIIGKGTAGMQTIEVLKVRETASGRRGVKCTFANVPGGSWTSLENFHQECVPA